MQKVYKNSMQKVYKNLRETGFVVKSETNPNLFLGIDSSSGGYAFLTPYITDAKICFSEEQAQKLMLAWNRNNIINRHSLTTSPILVESQ